MYILECNNSTYYTGSTKYLYRRILEHWIGEGANFTRKHKPLRLVYVEEFQRIDDAFYREKQVQNWSQQKKKALIESNYDILHNLAECKNESRAVPQLVPSAPLGDRGEMDRLCKCSIQDPVFERSRGVRAKAKDRE